MDAEMEKRILAVANAARGRLPNANADANGHWMGQMFQIFDELRAAHKLLLDAEGAIVQQSDGKTVRPAGSASSENIPYKDIVIEPVVLLPDDKLPPE